MEIKEVADKHGIPFDRDNLDELVDAAVDELEYLDGDETMAKSLAESELMDEMPLEEILEWKTDSFVKWDDNPGTGADAHAYFEQSSGISIDSMIEDHSISWYCRQGRYEYEVTNDRDQDGYRILTLRRT